MVNDNEKKNDKPYDLEQRTFEYAKDVFSFIHSFPKTTINNVIINQLVRSASSVGANYIEAREALSKKDFAMRIKICRKEAKESAYWLKLLDIGKSEEEKKKQILLKETGELLRIFSSIVEKVKENSLK